MVGLRKLRIRMVMVWGKILRGGGRDGTTVVERGQKSSCSYHGKVEAGRRFTLARRYRGTQVGIVKAEDKRGGSSLDVAAACGNYRVIVVSDWERSDQTEEAICPFRTPNEYLPTPRIPTTPTNPLASQGKLFQGVC